MPMADLKKVTLPPPPPQRNKISNFQISRPKKKKCRLSTLWALTWIICTPFDLIY